MHIAQLNIAQAKAPLDTPVMKDFVDNLEPVNAMAESSEGFIWRLKDEEGDATKIPIFNDPSLLVNMSVWASVESLKHFIFKTHHLTFLQRKGEWFEKMPMANQVLWWIQEDHIPTVAEAEQRLIYLRENGESPYAFSFRSKYEPADVVDEANIL